MASGHAAPTNDISKGYPHANCRLNAIRPRHMRKRIHPRGRFDQPFGILLTLDVKTLTVRYSSHTPRDCSAMHGAAILLGLTAAEVLGPAAETAMRYGLAKDRLIDHRPIPLSIPGMSADQ